MVSFTLDQLHAFEKTWEIHEALVERAQHMIDLSHSVHPFHYPETTVSSISEFNNGSIVFECDTYYLAFTFSQLLETDDNIIKTEALEKAKAFEEKEKEKKERDKKIQEEKNRDRELKQLAYLKSKYESEA